MKDSLSPKHRSTSIRLCSKILLLQGHSLKEIYLNNHFRVILTTNTEFLKTEILQ